jgi:hypothetical protein
MLVLKACVLHSIKLIASCLKLRVQGSEWWIPSLGQTSTRVQNLAPNIAEWYIQ